MVRGLPDPRGPWIRSSRDAQCVSPLLGKVSWTNVCRRRDTLALHRVLSHGSKHKACYPLSSHQCDGATLSSDELLAIIICLHVHASEVSCATDTCQARFFMFKATCQHGDTTQINIRLSYAKSARVLDGAARCSEAGQATSRVYWQACRLWPCARVLTVHVRTVMSETWHSVHMCAPRDAL